MDSLCQIIDAALVPDEIFVEIFRYLSVQSRKNIRLTCHRFYKLCDDSLIQADEVIILYQNDIIVRALYCLSAGSRTIQNIEFDKVHLRIEAILFFFELQGSYIRSLVFKDCFFDPGTLKSIIELCVNLRSIALECTSNNHAHVLNDFKMLERNLIVRNEITDLTLNLVNHHEYLSNRQFLRFFDIFPNIKKLNLKIPVGLVYCNMIRVAINSLFSFSCVYDQLLILANQLEILRIDFGCEVLFKSKSAETLNNIMNIRMKNLKEFSMKWIYSLTDVSIMSRSLLFEKLSRFDCTIIFKPTDAAESVSIFLQRLLKCTPLRSLSLVHYPIPMDRELFETFVKSKLISLRVKYRCPIFGGRNLTNFHRSSLENTLRPNYCLQYFSINDRCNLNSLFTTFFRNLTHLEISEVHNDVLQSIFHHDTRIQSLHIENYYRGDSFKELSYFQQWLRLEEETINRELKYLTYLEIFEDECSFTKFLSSEFSFPNLKSLYICILYNTFKEEQLWPLIRKLPKLEDLTLEVACATHFPQWLALFEDLSNLRNFHIRDNITGLNGFSEFFANSEYVQLFNVLPSLRSILHDKSYRANAYMYYYYDVTTKTVVGKTDLDTLIRPNFNRFVQFNSIQI